MRGLSKKYLMGLFIALVFSGITAPSHALSMYTRGSKAPINGHTPSRFLYTDPFYQHRAAVPKPECHPHGQARCLTPKKSNPFVLTRQNPAMQKVTVHPYLRKVIKPPITRIN